MVDIKPLRGLKYNTDKISNISEVLAPPYDIITAAQNEKLKNSNVFNFSFLTLPLETGQKNKYENANDIFTRWIDEGILVFENNECFYLIEEIFAEGNNKKSFFGIIGLLKVEEYGKGKVLRHEKTLPKPKEDRLNLLSTCRANFEFIYTLYDDNDKKVFNLLKKYPEEEKGKIQIGNIEIFPAWNAIIDNPEEVMKRAELIDGFKFIILEDLLLWKKKMGREKDFKDIEIIQKFLNK